MNDFKISLVSKRLRSGKCQIKFEISNADNDLMHGYLLSEAGDTLKNVVNRIEEQVRLSINGDRYYHSHLYNLHSKQRESDILIFKH